MLKARRAVATLLVLALFWSSPGVEGYQAFGQVLQGAGRVSKAPARLAPLPSAGNFKPLALPQGAARLAPPQAARLTPAAGLAAPAEPKPPRGEKRTELELAQDAAATAVSELARPETGIEGAHAVGQRMADGSGFNSEKTVSASEPVSVWSRLKKAAAVSVLAAGLGLAVPAPGAAQASVSAQVSVEKRDVTVGDRVRVVVTLKNNSDKPVNVSELGSALKKALPAELELEAAPDAPAALAPGESRPVAFDLIPFDSGELSVPQVETEGFVLPAFKVSVKTVLTPDWQEKGFKDIFDADSGQTPNFVLFGALGLGLSLLVGLKRLSAPKKYPGLAPGRPLLEETKARIAGLEKQSSALSGPEFYAELHDTLASFLIDRHGLPVKARSADELSSDLKKAGVLTEGQLSLARRLAARAQAGRFAGPSSDVEARRQDIISLKELVASVAANAANEEGGGSSKGKSLFGILGLIPGAAALQFGSPWALLLFIPVGALLVWSTLNRKPQTHTVASMESVDKSKTWRTRLSWLPKFLRHAAIALVLGALARPQLGVTRRESFTPSTDTITVTDLSGSMSEKFGREPGAPTKLEAAKKAVEAYIVEQRRGTTNRVGMVTFSDDPYLDVRLTTDYDALIAHLKELKTSDSTAIGKGMLTAISHFIEINIMELDGASDPRIAELQLKLQKGGLGKALEFLKANPDLTGKALRPDRKKIMVVFSDGESNSGIPPVEAAQIVKTLNEQYGFGARIYSVGIAPKDGSGGGFDEATMREISALTGGKFFRAGDAEGMKEILLEISKLEKSPTQLVSTLTVNEYQNLLALLAFLLLSLEVGLSSTALRRLPAFMLMAALPGAGVSMGPAPEPARKIEWKLPSAWNVPAEMAAGNAFYAQGRFEDAIKKYAEALAKHPDLKALYFNLGDAYLRLGDFDRANASYQKFLALKPEKTLASKAYHNMGNAALMLEKPDVKQAIAMYKEALRQDPANAQAKWNLEMALKARKEQQKDQEQEGEGEKKKGEKQEKKDQKEGEGKEKKEGQGEPKDGQGEGEKQEGKPGEGKGQEGKEGKSGLDQLQEKQGEQEGEAEEKALRDITRNGDGVWGVALLPMAFSFSEPLLLWGLAAALPVLAGFLAYGLIKKFKAAQSLAPAAAPASLPVWAGWRKFLVKSALVLGAGSLLGLGASGPIAGTKDERLNFGGKDILMAVDGSYSMVYASDGRLARTKKELSDFISHMQGSDRVGLVVFSGAARTASPLSIDYGNFAFKIRALEREARGLKEGSDLVAAIKHSAASFDTVKKIGDRPRILIVISDGDIFDQEIEQAVKAAKDAKISVYTIGVGSLEGTKMLVPTEDGKGTVYLRDSIGQPARSYLKEQPLRQIAARTGGAYFRAEKGATIEKVLENVAKIQKGSRGDVIQSPRGIASWFLWPSLLLLLLESLLPGAGFLPKKKENAGEPGKIGLMGMALLPLGAWPQILPFAAAATVFGLLILADLVSGGTLSRRARWALERWTGLVGKGMASDGARLFGAREADAAKISEYLARWRAATETDKPGLIEQAAADRQMWREKLSAIYLGGNKPGVQDKVLEVLTGLSRERLDSLASVVGRVRAESSNLKWLNHPDAVERLETLSRIGRPTPISVSEPSRAQGGWARKIFVTFAALFVAGSAALTGWSALKTFEFRRQQDAAGKEALQIIFAEDAFIFNDKYADARIPELVLPALAGRTGAAGLDRALDVLAKSSDPKADNILEAIFKRADFLSLPASVETKLLSALLERDNEQVWRFMEEHAVKSAGHPRTVARLMKMIDLGAAMDNEKIFQNLFYFLKSPNPELASHAASAVKAALAAPARAERFLERLGNVQAKFSQDPGLNIWLESIFWERLTSAPETFNQLNQARALLDRFKEAVKTWEPSLELMRRALERSRAERVTDTVLHAVNRDVKVLILEAEGLFSGLHAELIKAEVVLPDVSGYSRSHDDYDDYHGYGRGRGGGYYSTRHDYRQTYRLKHLRDLRRLIAQAGVSAEAALTAPQRDFLARVDANLEAMTALALSAGMPEGGTLGETVALELNAILYRGRWAFTTDTFLGALRKAGLAPDNDTVSETDSFRPSYDAKAVAEIKKFLAGMETTEKAERNYVAATLESLDVLMEKHYPGQADQAALPLGGLLARGRLDLAKKSLDALLGTPEEAVVLARLAAASERNQGAPDVQLWLLRRLLAQIARSQTDGQEAGEVLKKIVERAGEKSDQAWSLVERAVKQANAPAAKTLAPILEDQLNSLVKDFFYQTDYVFPELKTRVKALGGQTYGSFKLSDLIIIRKVVSQLAAEAGKNSTPEQLKMAAVAEVLFPRLISIAPKVLPKDLETPLYGLAPLGLVLVGGWSGILPVALLGLMFAALAAGFAYLWRLAPNAAAEAPSRDTRGRLARLGLASKRFADSPASGLFRSMAIGAGGTDFAEASVYNNEDRKFIDWKTSAKKGELYVKKFEQEKEMPLILMVDLSRSSRPGADENKRAVIEDVAATLALAAARLNVRVGAVFFSDKVEKVIAPKSGQRHGWEIARGLMEFEPQGRGTDLAPALELALRQYRSRALVIMISDALTPDLKFRDSLSAVASRHDFRLIRVSDPREKNPLPLAGLVRLEDAESGEIREVDTESPALRARQAAALQTRESELVSVLEDARVRPIEISTQGDYFETLLENFDPKQKQ